MKASASLFLQIVVGLIGAGALAFLLGEPHLEGRNAHATFFEIYFQDPFLAYVYIAAIPFFVALYQAFQVLGFAGRNQIFSEAAVNALRTIRYCALLVVGFVLVSVAFMPLADPDDGPPGIVMRIVSTFCMIVVATAAALFERVLRMAVEMKSENDLTI